MKANTLITLPICTCSSWLRDTNADVSSTQDTWMFPEGHSKVEHNITAMWMDGWMKLLLGGGVWVCVSIEY